MAFSQWITNCFRKIWACWNTVNIQLFPENIFQFYQEPQIMTTSAQICIHWKLKERCLHCFLHCTNIFVIAVFNPFCRDCTIRHSGDETWNVLNMQHNPKFQKMELFRHPRWWPSHMCDSGHHLRKVPIPDERYMIKKKVSELYHWMWGKCLTGKFCEQDPDSI